MSHSEILPGVPTVESPLFEALADELGFTGAERQVAHQLRERGYAVIDFPDPRIDERIERIKEHLGPRFDVDFSDATAPKNSGQVLRVQDAWTYDDDVRAIATNATVLELLGKLYGRAAFPFQTLNFPVGTQQHLHSDSVHFSSIPERFMCGVWLAMEDISADAGPLLYLPGSHKWPILSNSMVGRTGWGSELASAQDPFEAAWDAMVRQSGISEEVFLARKGQALIWAANLLHGGSLQTDPTLTRWSQVTHYYFDDCIYYTPAFSDEPLGRLHLRRVTDVKTGELRKNSFAGAEVVTLEEVEARRRRARAWSLRRLMGCEPRPSLPGDFDPETYLALNPDVRRAGIDPAKHYLRSGHKEARRYR